MLPCFDGDARSRTIQLLLSAPMEDGAENWTDLCREGKASGVQWS